MSESRTDSGINPQTGSRSVSEMESLLGGYRPFSTLVNAGLTNAERAQVCLGKVDSHVDHAYRRDLLGAAQTFALLAVADAITQARVSRGT